MAETCDLIVTGGMVFTASSLVETDVAIKGGKIAAFAAIAQRGTFSPPTGQEEMRRDVS